MGAGSLLQRAGQWTPGPPETDTHRPHHPDANTGRRWDTGRKEDRTPGATCRSLRVCCLSKPMGPAAPPQLPLECRAVRPDAQAARSPDTRRARCASPCSGTLTLPRGFPQVTPSLHCSVFSFMFYSLYRIIGEFLEETGVRTGYRVLQITAK